LNDAKRVSNKNWTMLLVYRSVWNDMVSQQKTRLAKLRALLGSMGSESRFPELVGLSASWIKKASAGNLPMTSKAAAAIFEATGISLLWLMGEGEDEPVQEDGRTPYTLDSFNKWKWSRRDEESPMNTFHNTLAVAQIFQVLAAVSQTKRESVAACELWEFVQSFEKNNGLNTDADDYCAGMLREVEKVFRKPAPLDKRPLAERIIKGRQAPATTPQKKQPSRKSKRPA